MLLQRVITALILLPVLLGAVWFAPTSVLYALFCGVAMLIAWEWAALMNWADQRKKRWAYVVISGALLALAWQVPERDHLLSWLLGIAVLWWCGVVLLFPGFPQNLQKKPLGAGFMSVLGLLLMSSTMLALARLHAERAGDQAHDGALRLLFFFFIVFAADTGAYLAGRNFGKHKLAPNISPGKTIEGAVGGLLLCALWALTAGVYVFRAQGMDVWVLLALTLVVAVVSIVGDLTESMFKRVAGLKDSGNLLPGHGGILDRVDSILAAAPTMVLGLLLTGL